MSAAEKLKALEPWLAKGSSREVVALVDALPQLVAVVEAAEEAVKRLREDRGGFQEWAKTKGALAALDRALQ